jgi:predicted nucleic acid-binding protein
VNEYVIDASVTVDALAGKGASAIALRARLAQSTCHAPHLLDAEVGHALRRALRQGEITEGEALTALRALPDFVDNRYPHAPHLIEHAWSLRHNVTFYDGLYAALSMLLDVPLLTGDVRLAAAPGLTCRIELVR